MNPIKAVILDLGGVVFELDWSRPIDLMGYRPESKKMDLPQFISEWEVYDKYERGEIKTNEFLGLLKEALGFPGSLQELQNAWNSLILAPVMGIESVLSQLTRQVNISGLSNTNEAHYLHITSTFSILSQFRKIYTSFELGLRKPEPAIFSAVIECLQVNPEQILFVDDSLSNIQAAKETGIQAEFCLNSSQKLFEIFSKYDLISTL